MQKFIFLPLLGLLFVAGCHGGLISRGILRADALLEEANGSRVTGKVSFTQIGERIRVIAEVGGLAPGPHGFHIHESRDCSVPESPRTDGHFNPLGRLHGNPELAEHHAGDMPMLIADAKGNARLSAYLKGARVENGERGIVGRSIIVHAGADDFKTQPEGGAGRPVACGVIVEK